MQNIFVVCIRNICRSPMADGLLNEALPGKAIRWAGLSAPIGKPADQLAVQFMAERGIDISALFRLGEVMNLDIADPYREGIGSFQYALRVIDESVTTFVEHIAQISCAVVQTEKPFSNRVLPQR